jgi:hypothetical protein
MCREIEAAYCKNHMELRAQDSEILELNLAAHKVITGLQRVNRLKPSGYFTYRQFNTHKFYVLPTQCVYVFCVDLRTNSDYFPIQH